MLGKYWRDNLSLWTFSFLKIPMLFYVRPRIEELNDLSCVIRVPLRRRTKNHLGSMYFAVMTAGADISGGLVAMRRVRQSGKTIAIIFKDLKADFLKRAEGDTLFRCDDGVAIGELVDRAISSGERVELPVTVTATVPSKLGTEPVARFVLTLSLRRK